MTGFWLGVLVGVVAGLLIALAAELADARAKRRSREFWLTHQRELAMRYGQETIRREQDAQNRP